MKLTKKSCIIKALLAMGFKEHMIECSEEKLPLKGYRGDIRAQKANIRIKGSGWGSTSNYVGEASNDLGFEKQADGTYAFHVSEYDSHKYGATWQDKFQRAYGSAVVHEVAVDQGFFVMSEETENEELVIRLQSPW
jgi:hypothetical protein